MDWLNQQPVWLQIVIGLAFFFIVAPALLGVVLKLYSAALEMLRPPIVRSPSPQPPTAPLQPEDADLLRALRALWPHRKESELIEYLNGKTRAEKRSLYLNPDIHAKLRQLGLDPWQTNDH